MAKTSSTLILAMIIALIHNGSSLQCYKCSSMETRECIDPIGDVPMEDCAKKFEFPSFGSGFHLPSDITTTTISTTTLRRYKCFKKKLGALYNRGCTIGDNMCSIYKNLKFKNYCETCEEDACNDAATGFLSPLLTCLPFVVSIHIT